MNSKSKRVSSAIALFLAFTMAQAYVGVSLAQSRAVAGPNDTSTTVAQQATGVVSIPSGKAIIINGSSAISGATIVSGASIETPAGVGAMVRFGNTGSLEIEPGARLSVEFQEGSIKVMLLQGCVLLRTYTGTAGEVANPNGEIGRTDPKADGTLRTCATDPVGAVLTAPAATVGEAGSLFGLGVAGDLALLAGFGFIVSSPFIFSGGNRNISPARPG